MAGSEQLPMLDEQVLTDWVVGQRWFGAKARDVAHLGVLAAVPLRTEEPLLAVTLLEARFGAGTHELYQVLLGGRPADEHFEEGFIGQAGDWTLYDGLADLDETRLLARLFNESAVQTVPEGTVRFEWTGAAEPIVADSHVRGMGAEQSNSSIVFDNRLVLKVFRRVEPGDNPELEMLRFLSEHGFESIPALAGWYEYEGDLMDATLGVLQGFVPDARDGWELALEQVASPHLIDRLRELGEVTGVMHATLASDPGDPDFAPEEPSEENFALLVATIDEQVERVFLDLPDDLPAVDPIRGRGEEVRDRLRMLAQAGVGGRLIRHHGDYHLGQTLHGRDGWVILDFEGEPARPLLERRRKRSALRDVAGMLRSFAYVATASEHQRARSAPEGWEAEARTAFLEGYMANVDGRLLPPSQSGVERLLSIFELEKAVYELRYELNNRPDWVSIPVAGIARLLEEAVPS